MSCDDGRGFPQRVAPRSGRPDGRLGKKRADMAWQSSAAASLRGQCQKISRREKHTPVGVPLRALSSGVGEGSVLSEHGR